WTRLALLQVRSCEVPLNSNPLRVRATLWGLNAVVGGIRSGQRPARPAEFEPGWVPQSDCPPDCTEVQVPGLLPGTFGWSTAGQTTAGMQLVCIVTPQTSGERSHASPLTTPVTGPSFVQAPISLLAVPMSAGTSDILDSFTCGLVLNPANVCAAVM